VVSVSSSSFVAAFATAFHSWYRTAQCTDLRVKAVKLLDDLRTA
jgi:hypothetical protein